MSTGMKALLAVGLAGLGAAGWAVANLGDDSGGEVAPEEIRGELLVVVPPAVEPEIEPPPAIDPPPDEPVLPEVEDEPPEVEPAVEAPVEPAPEEAEPPPKPPLTKADILARYPKDERGYALLGFKDLTSYPYPPPPELREGEPRPESPIPEEIRLLHGARVRIEGYMFPVRVVNGTIRSFLLMRGLPKCHFGKAHDPNEFIEVRRSDGIPVPHAQTLRVVGRLDVGEKYEEGRWLRSIYRILADDVTEIRTR